MPKILIVAEQSEGQLKRSTFSAVTFAHEEISKGGGSFAFVIVGSNIGGAAQGLQGYGADKVYVVDGAAFASYTAPAYAVAIAEAAKAYGAETVVSTATTFGKDVLPRVSARLNAGMASDITGVSGVHQYKRPMWAGNVLAEVKVTTPIAVVSVRGATFEQASPNGASSPVEALSVSAPAPKTRFVEFKKTISARPELTEARVVVAGGRALKSKENFAIIEQMADAMTAAVGASRAAVDSGYAPNDYQVGQTGKVVAPELYFAIGISGAIQHWAGMSGSKVIVAVNKDEEAPIMQLADYALVGDLFQVVPEFVREYAKIKG